MQNILQQNKQHNNKHSFNNVENKTKKKTWTYAGLDLTTCGTFRNYPHIVYHIALYNYTQYNYFIDKD
jgi:hypothetical protein